MMRPMNLRPTAAAALLLLAACRSPSASEEPTPAPAFMSGGGGGGAAVNFAGQPMGQDGGGNPAGGPQDAPPGGGGTPAEGQNQGPRWQPGEGPQFPIRLPNRIGWSCEETRPGKEGGSERLASVFLAEGPAFRMEQEDPRKGTHAIVSDGKALTTSVAGASRLPSPSDVDLRVRYGSLFEGDLARAELVGKERVAERECWHLKNGQSGGEENLSQGSLEIWLDTQTNEPRRILTTTPEGTRIELVCRDLPSTIAWTAADLDPASPGVRFVDKLGK